MYALGHIQHEYTNAAPTHSMVEALAAVILASTMGAALRFLNMCRIHVAMASSWHFILLFLLTVGLAEGPKRSRRSYWHPHLRSRALDGWGFRQNSTASTVTFSPPDYKTCRPFSQST